MTEDERTIQMGIMSGAEILYFAAVGGVCFLDVWAVFGKGRLKV
jgi:hypothetical protein